MKKKPLTLLAMFFIGNSVFAISQTTPMPALLSQGLGIFGIVLTIWSLVVFTWNFVFQKFYRI